jgi:hypothetical protein
VNGWELMPVLLLLLFSIALSAGLSIMVAVVRQARRTRSSAHRDSTAGACPYERTCLFRRPNCWMAIKSRNVRAVQAALGLHNPKPCSWTDGMEEKLFIAPPVQGWILVMGSGLPEPSDDVDACFRFVVEVSRKLGQVQFFSASRILHHHAWVRANRGRVVRAYAWAGKTLWQQGAFTMAEKDLSLKCYGYTESAERLSFNQPDPASVNADKVPLLAARWSLDPARIDERSLEKALGVAGEPSRRY